jgi:Domain of unknown function (DUF4251)
MVSTDGAKEICRNCIFTKKIMRAIILSRLVLIPLLFLYLPSWSQQTADQKKDEDFALLKSRIDSRHFRFQARSATTQRGKTIQLTSDYSLSLNQDSLDVALPYYGRAYSTSYPATDNGLTFKSTGFGYVADSAKKGGWNIRLDKIKNSSGVTRITLDISSSGYCTVRVLSNTRDMISFYGSIQSFDSR